MDEKLSLWIDMFSKSITNINLLFVRLKINQFLSEQSVFLKQLFHHEFIKIQHKNTNGD